MDTALELRLPYQYYGSNMRFPCISRAAAPTSATKPITLWTAERCIIMAVLVTPGEVMKTSQCNICYAYLLSVSPETQADNRRHDTALSKTLLQWSGKEFVFTCPCPTGKTSLAIWVPTTSNTTRNVTFISVLKVNRYADNALSRGERGSSMVLTLRPSHRHAHQVTKDELCIVILMRITISGTSTGIPQDRCLSESDTQTQGMG